MPAINNNNFYNATAGRQAGGNSKQMLYLGIGIIIVVIATYATYRYFTQGVGQDAPVVRTEEATGVRPVGESQEDTLPQEVQDIQDALTIYNAIADKPLDTEFFNSAKFIGLTGGAVVIPEASPRPGRVFELWESPQTGSTPTANVSPLTPTVNRVLR